MTDLSSVSFFERVLQYRHKLVGWLRLPDTHKMLVWAVLAGILGAWSTEVFRAAIALIQRSYAGMDGSLVDIAKKLSPWWRLLVPAIGGLVAGLMLWLAARLPGNKSRSDYMEAVSIGDGSLPVRASSLRIVSSLATISSGGSIGREGSMVQLAALLLSLTGRVCRLDRERLKLLVACGAAAGITSAYSAPIAGAFFISEIVLGTVAMESFGPILIASVVANVTMREFSGYEPPYAMPVFPAVHPRELILFALLGICCGVLAPRFLQLLEVTRQHVSHWIKTPPLRMCLGGLLLGLISLAIPEVWGNGYTVVSAILHQSFGWQLVLMILLAKICATMASVGSGAVGGVFTPTLFVGGAFGFLFGCLLQAVPLFGFVADAPYAYAVVGMGAFLGAATSAPLMAILMIFEMTLNYDVMLPLMLATIVAYFFARATSSMSMYDVVSKRRQAEVERSRLRCLSVRELIRPAETVVALDAERADMAKMFLRYPVKYLYVVNEMQAFQGVIAVADVTQDLLDEGEGQSTHPGQPLLAGAIVRREFPRLCPDDTLQAALSAFLAFKGERLPVVDRRDGTLLGVADKSTVLDACMKLGDIRPELAPHV